MAHRVRLVGGMLAATVLLTFMIGTDTASAAGVVQDKAVSIVPSDRTPHVLDGAVIGKDKVLDIEEVGSRILVVGEFTDVQDSAANGGRAFTRNYVFAFDKSSGAIDRSFAPAVNGIVRTVTAGPGDTVYLGGTFTTVNGQTRRNVAQVSLADGSTTAFRAVSINGAVNDLRLWGGRLFVGGTFDTVGGVMHSGLATLDPSTGGLDPYMDVDVTVNHNYPRGSARASVGVSNFDISPDGKRLVAIGNFRLAEGQNRDQVVVLLLLAGTADVDPNWRTLGYEAACNANAFDSYVRDVEYAPDGSFFSVVSTGGPYANTLCDTATRFDTASTGLDVKPVWVASTGGDTLFSVAVTDRVVYVGGHQRWLNNPLGRDSAGAGAVPRPGLAALDARSGVPLSWNAARHPRGIGAEALTVTSAGLYVGSDTEYIGNRKYKRQRLAFLPLAGGGDLPAGVVAPLPADVFLAGRMNALGTADNSVVARHFTGSTSTADVTQPTGGLQWSRARGAVQVDDTLFYGYPNSSGAYRLYERTFDGKTYGPATEIVNPYLDPAWSNVSTGSGQTYKGALPNFYGQLSSVSAMFYRDGRLYYTRSGAQGLYYRFFSLDSGIVGATEFTAAGTGYGDVAGAFVSGDSLYWSSRTTGDLRRVAFLNGAPSGAATVVSGPSKDGRDWRARAVFVGPVPNKAPTAAVTTSCVDLTCSFDGSGSTDPDGTLASYAWDFGDGTKGAGAQAQHAYASAGNYTARLTVTDDDGATAEATATVTVAAPAPGTGIGFRGSAGTAARAVTTVSVTVPDSVRAGDGLVLVLSTNSTATGTAPAGWAATGAPVTAGAALSTQVFQRVAGAADAGSTVQVALSAQAKVTLQLMAYAGTAAAGPVASVTGASDSGGTAHTTPTATAAAGSWVLSVWSDKSSGARSFTAPSGTTVRDNRAGVGSGDVATLVADSGSAFPAGRVGGLTATVPTASAAATMLTVVLAKGDGTAPPANVPPTAAVSSSCADLVCTFDAGGSTDPDGVITTYAWDFGDGTTGTGAEVEHTFPAAGEYTVRLTVTDDDGATAQQSALVTVAVTPAPTGIGLRGSAGTAARAVTTVSVTVPDSVRAGDGLVLVLSTNSTATGTAPAGWAATGAPVTAGAALSTQVFQRVAGAADAGSTVQVALSAQAKVTLQLMAYAGTAAAGPVASVTGASDSGGTAHTTPTATAAAGSWVLSVWSDKSSAQRQFTAPTAGTTERSNIAGIGSGDIATLLADSGAPVAAGQVGGLTATVPTASTRATMLTVVLAPIGG